MEKLTKETFKEKVFDFETKKEWEYAGSLPSIVDFYADWCGPCKMVAPILEEISKTFEGKINIYKINTDEQQEVAGVFGISSIPSILFIPKDDKPQMAIGGMSKAGFMSAIKEVLKVE